MKPLLFICAFSGLWAVRAQPLPPPAFSVTPLAALSISLSSADELERPVTIPYAVALKRSGLGKKVSATLEISNPSAAIFLSGKIQLKLSAVSGVPAGGTYPLHLTPSAELPAPPVPAGTRGGPMEYYDLVLEPLGYFLPPGSYSFSIVFTESTP